MTKYRINPTLPYAPPMGRRMPRRWTAAKMITTSTMNVMLQTMICGIVSNCLGNISFKNK
jgi:hypothetical protein